MSEDLLELGRRILASQPFSALLGAELTRFEPGLAELRIPVSAQLTQHHGFVHGGVVSYLADNALTYAAGGLLGTDLLTAEFKINYLRPAQGRELIARASVLSAGRTLAVARCEVYAFGDSGETLVAAAQGTISRVSRGESRD